MSTQTISLQDGQILFLEGDPGGRLFLIKSGTIQIYKNQIHGEPVDLSRMQAGEVVGTLSLFENSTRTASAKAVGPTVVEAFAADNLTNMAQSTVPLWYQSIMKDILGRFFSLEKKYLQALRDLERLENKIVYKSKK